MQAHELMTKEVVSESLETPVHEIAQLLLTNHISALPVVDASGMVVGMVSEGDLIGRSDAERDARRDSWLALIAEGEGLSTDFLASLRSPGHTARDVMSSPVIRVTEMTEASEVAAVLRQYRIKRVPVVRDGRVVGIVSRADLLRAAEGGQPHPAAVERVARTRKLLAEALESLDHRFFGHGNDRAASASDQPQAISAGGFNVADFRSLVAGFEDRKVALLEARRQAAAGRRSQKVKELIDEHVRDENWKALLHRAREAAEHGEQEFLLLRFPSDLCTDRGRAINAALTDWPETLRGEAAEIYLRWETELKQRGFHLTARVLEFPHGMPGDVGLFLGWGQ